MIEVTREHSDTEREVWKFSVMSGYSDSVTIKLSSYAKQERQSRRHKFKDVRKWDSYDERSYFSSVKRVEVPEPDDVIAEAIASVGVNYSPLERTA